MPIEQAPNTGSSGAGGFVLSMPRYNAGFNQSNASPSSRKNIQDLTGQPLDVDFFAGAEGIGNFGGFAVGTKEYDEYQVKVQDLNKFINTAAEKRYDPRVVEMGSKDSWEINKEYRARMSELKQLGNMLHFAKPLEQGLLKEGILFDRNAPIGVERYGNSVSPYGLTDMSEQLSKGVSVQPYTTGEEFNSASENYNIGLQSITDNYMSLKERFKGDPIAIQKLDQDYRRALSQLQRPTGGNPILRNDQYTPQERAQIQLYKEGVSIERARIARLEEKERKFQTEVNDWKNSFAIVLDGGSIVLTSSDGGRTTYPFSKVIIDASVQPSTSIAFSSNQKGGDYKKRTFDKITLDNLIIVPITKSGRVLMPGDKTVDTDPVSRFDIRSSGVGVKKVGNKNSSFNVTLPESNLLEKLTGAKKEALRIKRDELRLEVERRNAEIKGYKYDAGDFD